MKLLSVDASGGTASLAAFEKGSLRAFWSQGAPRNTAESLVPAVDAMLNELGWAPADIARWAVDVGPGSFTGTRVALSFVKGVALATGADVVGVCSLDVLATVASATAAAGGGVGAVLQVSKSELYVQAREGETLICAPQALAPALLPAWLNETHCDAYVLEGLFDSHDPLKAAPGEVHVNLPHQSGFTWLCARAVGRLATAKEPSDLEMLEPMYLRGAFG